MLKMHFILVFFLSLLIGCSTTPIIKNQVSQVSGMSVKYIFSSEAEKRNLVFHTYQNNNAYQNRPNYYEGLRVSSANGDIALIKYLNREGRMDDESINEYIIKKEIVGNSIILKPYQNRLNQNSTLGGVFAYKIPTFTSDEVIEILSSTTHGFTFEVDSKFESESVNGNFRRLASRDFTKFSAGEKIYENSYYLALEGVDVKIEVTTYPYRNGSKCTVSARYKTKPNTSNIISITEIEEKIKVAVEKIVNA